MGRHLFCRQKSQKMLNDVMFRISGFNVRSSECGARSRGRKDDGVFSVLGKS